jgi:hypothetical protein
MTNSRKIIALQALLNRGKGWVIGGAKDLALKMYFDICESNFSQFRTILGYKNKKKLSAPIPHFSRITCCYGVTLRAQRYTVTP